MNKVKNPITVIIADDHQLIREGFVSMLNDDPEIEIVAAVKNGSELVVATTTFLPKVIVTDIKMPVMSGVEATRIIKSAFPGVEVIGMSVYDDLLVIEDMINLGVSGYLMKDASAHQLSEAIKTVAAGGEYYCKEIEKKIEQIRQKGKRPANHIVLTERQIEIMKLIAQGKTNGNIAKQLHISKRTVETHRHNLYAKIGVNIPVGVALYARRHGYLDELDVKG